MGRFVESQEIDKGILARCRRVLGEDDPYTLDIANSLASDLRGLGEVPAARELDEDTLARRQRILGDDHPSTLTSAGNLAIDLSGMGEYQAARQLGEDTLARRRRALGTDHPDTLTAANNLAIFMRTLGDAPTTSDVDDAGVRHRQAVQGTKELATLAAEITPCIVAAIDAYGEEVLAKTQDDAADPATSLGRRLLQRVFGWRGNADPLPEILEEVIANPDDEDYIAGLRMVIRKALAADAQMLAEIREIFTEGPPNVTVTQHVAGGRDAYVAGRDMMITRRTDQ
jgi:hypothetical protein